MTEDDYTAPTDAELGYDREKTPRAFEDELHILVGVAATHYDLDRETIVATFEDTAQHYAKHGADAFMMSNPEKPPVPDSSSTRFRGDLALTISRYTATPDVEGPDGKVLVEGKDGITPDEIVAGLEAVGEKVADGQYAPSI